MATFVTKPDPNTFGNMIGKPWLGGVEVPRNGDPLLDQYGEPYVSGPQSFIIENVPPPTNVEIAASRMNSQAASQQSWGQTIGEWYKKYIPMLWSVTNPGLAIASGATNNSGPAAAVFQGAKDKATSYLWKLGFILVIVFVGYLFIKAVAARGAAKVIPS